MVSLRIAPLGGRRLSVVASAFIVLLTFSASASVFHAQTPPPQTPPPQTPPQPATQPPAAAPKTTTFAGDAALVFNQIKPDKTADFEMAIQKMKEALQKSQDPVRKQQAAGWKVFKSLEPAPGGNVWYIFVIDPVVKDADYTDSKILAEGFPTEITELFKTYQGAFVALNRVNLQLVAHLGK